jgi:hypothetical protein
MGEWILTSEQKPEPGQLVVKYWAATGNVWAGKHIAHAKHESFDKWVPLPEPSNLK